MKKVLAILFAMMFVVATTGLCFAQAAPEKAPAPAGEKKEMKAEKKEMKAEKKEMKSEKKEKKAKKEKKEKKAEKKAEKKEAPKKEAAPAPAPEKK